MRTFELWMMLEIALLLGYPILVASLWLMRFRQGRVFPPWRGVMSWVAVSLATAALGAWTGTFFFARQTTIEQSIQHLRNGVNTSLTFCASAVVAAFLAKGKVRVWTAVSALIVPFYYSLERVVFRVVSR